MIEKDANNLSRYPATKAYFFDNDGNPIKAGTKLTNPAYANTLLQIADYGPKAVISGRDIARDIVATVQQAEGNPGVLNNAMDLASYSVKQREPICAPYRQYKVWHGTTKLWRTDIRANIGNAKSLSAG